MWRATILHPHTQITLQDLEQGVWRFNESLSTTLGLEAGYVQEDLLHYARRLGHSGHYASTVWPYHAMLGSIGHALVPAFEEALFFHGDCPPQPAGVPSQGQRSL
jgi:nicotinamidase-related amidase